MLSLNKSFLFVRDYAVDKYLPVTECISISTKHGLGDQCWCEKPKPCQVSKYVAQFSFLANPKAQENNLYLNNYASKIIENTKTIKKVRINEQKQSI